MPVAYHRGTKLGQNDLSIQILNISAVLVDPQRIYYTIFDATSGTDVLFGLLENDPVRVSTGIYYAPFQVPDAANLGTWKIVWHFRETLSAPYSAYSQLFEIVGLDVVIGNFSAAEKALIQRLRLKLRDNDPDRNYHFVPPSPETEIQSYSERYRFLWEDIELQDCIYDAMGTINLTPPASSYTVDNLPQHWQSIVLAVASIEAINRISINWVADQFSYSIGGVSLDLNKAELYIQMKESLVGQVYGEGGALQRAKATINITRGLSHERWNIGLKSRLGPYSGRGVQVPRNFTDRSRGY